MSPDHLRNRVRADHLQRVICCSLIVGFALIVTIRCASALASEIHGGGVRNEVAVAPESLNVSRLDQSAETSDESFFDQITDFLDDPTVAYILVCLGLLGIYLEFSAPGVTVPGLLGLISLSVGLYYLSTMPVDWMGVALIALSFLMFVVDLYVPSLGLLTLGGLVAFVAGSLLLFGDDVASEYEIEPAAIWTFTACFVLMSIFVGAAVMRVRGRPVATGPQSMIGTLGEARTEIAPTGMIMLQGELWEARLASGAEHIPEGQPVTVVKIRGLTAQVRTATAAEIEGARPKQVDRRRVIPGDVPADSPSSI